MNWFQSQSRGLAGLSRRIVYMGLYHCRVSHRLFFKHISRKLLDIVVACGGGYDRSCFVLVALGNPRLSMQENSYGSLAWLPAAIGFLTWEFFPPLN